eukprot:TRINITY_DN45314_c0_g1_i1.p1 TRINITY_DN45314_c0_g1~~TRINITY_DN45314_c0_g1_i1.p1  ORF type:complete len:291 (-),score=67.68 TRINITY_DN45314_c0_g1_i1:164-1036(-)
MCIRDRDDFDTQPTSKRLFDINGFVDRDGSFKKQRSAEQLPNFSMADLDKENVLQPANTPNLDAESAAAPENAPMDPPERTPRGVPSSRYLTSPPESPSIEVTCPETGDTLYVPIGASRPLVGSTDPIAFKGMLSTSIEGLLSQIESERVDATLKESTMTEQVQPASSVADGAVWSDKHRPQYYIDLVSAGNINRDVLSWVKAWDPCVFQPKQNKRTQASMMGQHPEPTEDTSRPEKRVILIAGPPGAGKTTLAHVVALHAGYKPFEINASSDRTEKLLLSQIEDATEMQ